MRVKKTKFNNKKIKGTLNTYYKKKDVKVITYKLTFWEVCKIIFLFNWKVYAITIKKDGKVSLPWLSTKNPINSVKTNSLPKYKGRPKPPKKNAKK